jgi:hypothetical protein
MATEQLVTKGPAFKLAHPEEILREDVFPEPGISRAAFARHMGGAALQTAKRSAARDA